MPADDNNNIAEILKHFDSLPDDAVVTTKVASIVHSVSDRTVRREYPCVKLSPNRKGVRVGWLRALARGEPTT